MSGLAEHRARVLVHLIGMPDPATVTAADMHDAHPELTVAGWGAVLRGMGRIDPRAHRRRLLHPVGRLDVRGDTTRWALTGLGWAAARRLTQGAA